MSSVEKVIVKAPATIANFGPGYDTFGLCLDAPSDIITVERSDMEGITITQQFPETGEPEKSWRVPMDPRSNTAGVAAGELLRMSDSRIGLRIIIQKGIRAGSGLGSSAASAVGGALATAELIGVRDRRKILAAAAKGEAAASGAAHLDNVSPCLFGGFTVVIDQAEQEVLRISPPDMKIVVCQPSIVVETAMSRKLIPSSVPTRTAVAHSSWASGIVYGMMTKDIRLIARCLRDEIAVPARKTLIKGFEEVRDAAMAAGALSFSISGSGPTVYSLAVRNHIRIGKAMMNAFARSGVESEFFITRRGKGAKVIRKE